MAKKSLVWNGDKVTAKMRQAQIAGVNATMGACVVFSKANHRWQNRTGILEGGINIVDYAAPDANGVVGTWGVQDVIYALIQELGGVVTGGKELAGEVDREGGIGEPVVPFDEVAGAAVDDAAQALGGGEGARAKVARGAGFGHGVIPPPRCGSARGRKGGRLAQLRRARNAPEWALNGYPRCVP